MYSPARCSTVVLQVFSFYANAPRIDIKCSISHDDIGFSYRILGQLVFFSAT